MADKYGTKDMFSNALKEEGVSSKLADIAWAIYGAESGGGGTKTSVSGARGGMQIMPDTFKSVADKDWNIDNPEHNARAGIRYLKQMHERADGDIGLTAAGYNGGPGAIAAAKQGKGLYVKGHPEYGSTLDYAENIKKRIGETANVIETKDAPIVEAKVAPVPVVTSPGLALAAKPAPAVNTTVAQAPVIKEAPVAVVAAPVVKDAPAQVVVAVPVEKAVNPMAEMQAADPVTPEALQYAQAVVPKQPNLYEMMDAYGAESPVATVTPMRSLQQMAQLQQSQNIRKAAAAANLGEGLVPVDTRVAGTNEQLVQIQQDNRPMATFNNILANQRAEAMNYG